MRICIVTTAGYVHGLGGMQRHTSDLARGLVEAGHEVEVITNRHPDGTHLVRHEGALWRFVDAAGKGVDPAWHRASYAEFVAAHGERPFDVVHSESTCALGLVRMGVHRQVPLVAKYHGNFFGLTRAHVRRAIRGRTAYAFAREARGFMELCGRHFPRGNWWRFHGIEAMVGSHQQVVDQHRSQCIPRSRIHVVPNAVDVDRFYPRDREQTRTDLGIGPEPLVVAVGRLARDKGMHVAIAALARLQPPVRLVIVGDGSERRRLESLAARLGVLDRVEFLGGLPAADVAKYVAAADVFVFPTERDEGAPMVLLEAMACGVPVVASRIAQIEEVIDRPGENGVLVRQGDVSATADAIDGILRDPAHAARVGAAARERILAEYTLERMIERTVAVYEIAIREHRGAERGISVVDR